MMQMPRRASRSRKTAARMENLENRTLLSATIVAHIATQTVAAGQTPTPISLSAYFNDPTVTGTAVELQTPVGNIPLVLTDSQTPQTVANFEHYITSGEYANTIIHRSVPGFIVQGGGYATDGTHIATFGTIPGEHNESNVTGTIAMALSTGPNSGTSEWFINLADNNGTTTGTPNLDDTSDGGPFTAFGNVVYNGMNVVNAIANLPIVNDATQSGAFTNLPVLSGTNGATVGSEPGSNMVTINPVIVPGGLTYSAVSSNPNLVSASVDASGNLTLTPVNGGGTATINIVATDMGGRSVKQKFTVNVGSDSPVVTIGTGGVKSCTFTASNGALTTVALQGPGVATLDFVGSGISQFTNRSITSVSGSTLGIASITTTGTTGASVLAITARRGAGAEVVGSITTDALRSLVAPAVALGANVTSSAGIAAINVASASGGTITAAALGTVSVSGSLADNINLSGGFTSVRAGSIAGGTWNIGGAARSITTASVANFSATFSQSLALASVRGTFSGTLTAASVGTIVAGAVSDSHIFLTGTGTDLVRLSDAGVFSASQINSAGNIGAVTAASMANSQIYAGVGALSDASVLPGSTADLSALASIASVRLRGTFSNSDIAAATLGSLTLGTLQTSNGGVPAGVAGESIKLLTATANKRFTLRNMTSAAAVAAALTADGVVLGDIVIAVLSAPVA